MILSEFRNIYYLFQYLFHNFLYSFSEAFQKTLPANIASHFLPDANWHHTIFVTAARSPVRQFIYKVYIYIIYILSHREIPGRGRLWGEDQGS